MAANVELFGFEMHFGDRTISDSYVDDFITGYLDKNKIFWGGGWDPHNMQGCLSGDERDRDALKALVAEFIDRFAVAESVVITAYREEDKDTLEELSLPDRVSIQLDLLLEEDDEVYSQ